MTTKQRRKEKYDSGPYHGWTNWATWNMFTVLTNEQESYQRARKVAEAYQAETMSLEHASRELMKIYRAIPYTVGTRDCKQFVNWEEVIGGLLE